jgi:hypothetical protein
MLKIDIRPGLKAFRRDFDNFAKKQLPFATARALTETARKAAAAETRDMSQMLDRPTPFTMRGPAVMPATKSNLTAVLDMRPIQAAYLAPEEFGEPQKVSKTAVLVPIDAALNSYGNLPPGALKRYKGRKDVFVGRLTMKSGHVIGGVWQRIGPHSAPARVGRYKGKPAQPAIPGHLKLLITFELPVIPKVRLGLHDTALATIQREIGPELTRQLANAMRTAK